MMSLNDLPQLNAGQKAAARQKRDTPLALPHGKELPNRLALAPMAGSTCRAFRVQAQRFGAGLTVTELVSARGICRDDELKRSARYLALGEVETAAIQLFGFEPEDFEGAIHRLMEEPEYQHVTLIDINMGCPVNKVVNNHAGAALLRDPERAGRIVAASLRAAAQYDLPVSCKIRTSWDGEPESAERLLDAVQEAGVQLICVHGRSREAFYSGEADWERILELAARVDVPFYANGDLASENDILRALSYAEIDGVMVGRAALGAPWLFAELTGGSPPAPEERAAIIREHLENLVEDLGEATACREFRSQLMHYFKDFRGAVDLRRAAGRFGKPEELDALLTQYVNALHAEAEA